MGIHPREEGKEVEEEEEERKGDERRGGTKVGGKQVAGSGKEREKNGTRDKERRARRWR